MTDTPEARIRAVLDSAGDTDPTAPLVEAAIALRDTGLGQRELFVAVNRVREATDEEDLVTRDALEVVLDRVSGWCEPRNRLYP